LVKIFGFQLLNISENKAFKTTMLKRIKVKAKK